MKGKERKIPPKLVGFPQENRLVSYLNRDGTVTEATAFVES